MPLTSTPVPWIEDDGVWKASLWNEPSVGLRSVQAQKYPPDIQSLFAHCLVMLRISALFKNQPQTVLEYLMVELFYVKNILSQRV